MKIFHKIQTAIDTLRSSFSPMKESPDEVLGELFRDVQLGRLHVDGKTFVDSIPKASKRRILKTYMINRDDPDFDLKEFVEQHFSSEIEQMGYKSNPDHTVEQHINELWNVLTVRTPRNKGSLLALPHPYVVPGGRFKEQYYWDSYFIMLGLVVAGQWKLLEGMIKNAAYMIRKYDFVPTANRTYFLSRSQPPFFALMVRLLAKKQGKLALVKYLPFMLIEYKFWTRGDRSTEIMAGTRSVKMPDGHVLTHYDDDKRTPRPESFKEDDEIGNLAHGRMVGDVYGNLRAGAESGWDFSSRWLNGGYNLELIDVVHISPIDLNCLVYELERTIADAYRALKQDLLAKRFDRKAEQRKQTIIKYHWSAGHEFFMDWNIAADDFSPSMTLAGMFPLYVGAATQHQADIVAKTLKDKFLKKGGLTTSLIRTGQQWDLPNGWAPLHWVAVKGLRRYGHNDLADEIKKRWLATNDHNYKQDHKLVEKYNVVDRAPGGGGEYALQDGFGWTNGVYAALMHEDQLPEL